MTAGMQELGRYNMGRKVSSLQVPPVASLPIIIVARVRETGAAALGAHTATPGFPVSPAWVRQAVYLDNSGFTS